MKNIRQASIYGALSVAVTSVAVLFLRPMGSADPAVLRGQSIQLVSPDGKNIVWISAANSHTVFSMRTADGRGSVVLMSNGDSDQFRLGGYGARDHVISIAADESTSKGSSITFLNKSGEIQKEITREQ